MFTKLWGGCIPLQPVSGRTSQYLEPVPNGLRWAGVHPSLPHAIYRILVKRSFQKLFQDANLELEVKVKSPGDVRVLYRQQGNFMASSIDLPEMERLIGGHLVEFLLDKPEPRKISGMYALLYEADRSCCPWTAEIDAYRTNLSINWNAIDLESEILIEPSL